MEGNIISSVDDAVDWSRFAIVRSVIRPIPDRLALVKSYYGRSWITSFSKDILLVVIACVLPIKSYHPSVCVSSQVVK